MPQDPIEIIETIISNAMATASEYADEADSAAEKIIREQIGMYLVPPPTSTGFEVAAVEPEIPATTDTDAAYQSQLDKVVKLLSDQLADFFDLYYPLNADAFDEATNWLVNTITNGGKGINTDIENQLWQRARERIITDGSRVEQQIVVGYAAKGYSLPPGSMLAKIDEARFQQLKATGEASTTIAAKQYEAELETVKFAVEQAIKSRQAAMGAAADYIRAIAAAPDTASKVATLHDENKAKMMQAAASWYGTRLDRDKIVLQSKLADMDMGFKVYENRRRQVTMDDQVRVQALGHAADVYARAAAAALSSLNSIVSTASNI